jgi:hypothetical protein
LYLPSTGSQSLTILQPSDAQPPTDLRVDLVDGSLVRFRWTPPRFGPAPESYILEGGVNPGDVLAALPTATSSPVFEISVPAGSWHARLRTLAAGSTSGNSNEVPIFVAVPVVPSAPESFTAGVNGSTLGLSWKNTFEGGPPDNIVLDVTGSAIASLPLGAAEAVAFSGVPAGTYTLRLRAMNGGGSSASSTPVTLSVPGACANAPGVPVNALAYRVGSTITVIWDPPPSGEAPTGYLLRVTGSYVGTFPLGDRSISAPVSAGSYTISVASVNACGASPFSSDQTVVVP